MKQNAANQIRSNNGLTLLELLTVIAIVSIMVTIAVPNYMEWVHSSRLKSAAQTLMTDLSLARMHAIKANDPTKVGVKILFSSSDYTMFIDSNKDNIVDLTEQILKDVDLPSGISVSANTLTGNMALFHKTGWARPGSVTISRSDGKSIKIIVNAVGRIRMET
jgi:type IV fimbrial biogenesis protein FimT